VPTETLFLGTADGLTLVGELSLPASGALGVAVVCHPHPQYGGTMHNAVVDAIARAVAGAGAACVRFNFRGVGSSEGTYGGGVDERLDVAAALDAVAPFAGTGPTLLAGYSFGALVALNVTDPRIDGWFAVAPPLRDGAKAPLAAADHRPKRILAAEHDQFTPPPVARDVTGAWTNTTLDVVPMADHFLAGSLTAVADAAAACFRERAGR
jgi:alpha/beta superfamily hydrolase